MNFRFDQIEAILKRLNLAYQTDKYDGGYEITKIYPYTFKFGDKVVRIGASRNDVILGNVYVIRSVSPKSRSSSKFSLYQDIRLEGSNSEYVSYKFLPLSLFEERKSHLPEWLL